VTHRLARPGTFSRRLSIPNPVAQYRLSAEVAASWTPISAHIGLSPLTLTALVDDASKGRALAPAGSPDLMDDRAFERGIGGFQLTTDISQCYPSIYTHSLPWALHTKAIAKLNRADPSYLGNRLDRWARISQSDQTIGIPVGPDTSHVLAEIILSSCDQELMQALPKTRGYRYYDDYELYFVTRQEADRALSKLEAVLAGYQLSLNSRKTSVLPLPQPMDERWLRRLRRIDLRSKPALEKSDLGLLFDEAIDFAAEFPDRHVLSYALGRFAFRLEEDKVLVHPDNWTYFQRLLLQAVQAEPTAISKVYYLLAWGKERGLQLDKGTLSTALSSIVQQYAFRGESSEVAWILWTALDLGLFIGAKAGAAIALLDDDIVAILSLAAADRRRLSRSVDTSRWSAWLTGPELEGEHWLAAYEAVVAGWLKPPTGNYIAANAAFQHLRSNNVRFYAPPPAVATPKSMPRVRLAPLPPGRARYM
jgi:hypothetical protein